MLTFFKGKTPTQKQRNIDFDLVYMTTQLSRYLKPSKLMEFYPATEGSLIISNSVTSFMSNGKML